VGGGGYDHVRGKGLIAGNFEKIPPPPERLSMGGSGFPYKRDGDVFLVSLSVFNLKRSTVGALQYLLGYWTKKIGQEITCYVRILVPLRGEKNFKPLPQNRIWVLLRGSFQTF